MNRDTKLIFEAFLKAINNKAYISISYSDRGMNQTKITTVDNSRLLPNLLRHGVAKLLGISIMIPEDSITMYKPEGVSFTSALKLSVKGQDIIFSCTDGEDIVTVVHNLESVYEELIGDSGVDDKTAKLIMERLIDDNVVDYFYYGEGNHFDEPAHAVFYKTSTDPKDWYKVNSLNEVGQIIGKTLSDIHGSRDFEEPKDPNREDPDTWY